MCLIYMRFVLVYSVIVRSDKRSVFNVNTSDVKNRISGFDSFRQSRDSKGILGQRTRVRNNYTGVLHVRFETRKALYLPRR